MALGVLVILVLVVQEILALVVLVILVLAVLVILVLVVQEILALAALDLQVAQEFQMLQVPLGVLNFQADQLFLEAQSLYRVQ